MPKFNPDLFRRTVEEQGQKTGSNLVGSEEEVKRAMELYPGDTVCEPERGLTQQINKADIALFDDNPNNHWRRIAGEQWDEFVSSIREYGVLTPMIVRKKADGRLEILAGHNRKYGALEAGLEELPYVIMDVDDVDASVILGISNNQRKDITDREWGWAYRNTYESLKKAVGRPKAEGADQGSGTEKNVPTVGTFPKGARTMETVAKKYGVGKGTVERKMRLTFLEDKVYDLCTKRKYSLKILIELSYLSPENQIALMHLIESNTVTVTEEIAKDLREKAREQALSVDEILACCNIEEQTDTKGKRGKRYSVDDALFPETLKQTERETYIIRALEYIREHGIELAYD